MFQKTIKKFSSPFKGFTLTELIVVITILAILWAIGFVSLWWYTSHSRDSKRVSSVAIISEWFDVALAQGTPINTSQTATGSNIVVIWSGMTLTGYYGPVNTALLDSIRVFSNDLAIHDGFQIYRYGYYPSTTKYQVFAVLENPMTSLAFSPIIDQAFATTGSGYVFMKGNFIATGSINSLVVSEEVWNTETPLGWVRTFSGSETVNPGDSVTSSLPEDNAPEVTPENWACGTAQGGSFTISPTTDLCSIGTPTTVTDGGVNSAYTWGCSWVNGGEAINTCSANHIAGVCTFDESNFDQCVFAP